MRLLAQAFLVLTFLVMSGSARAVVIAPDEIFTLDSSIGWSLPTGQFGTIDPYDLSDGTLDFAAGGVCLSDASCGGAAQDWIIFRITVDALSVGGSVPNVGAIDEVGASALFLPTSLDAGYFNNVGGTAPFSVDITTNPDTPTFTFAPLLQPGTESAPLFVAFPDGLPTASPFPPAHPNYPNNTQFMVGVGGAAEAFLAEVNTLIPEPGTFLLLGSGLLGLGVMGRRPRG